MRVQYYLKHYVDQEALVRLWTWHPHGHGLVSKYTRDGKMDDTCTVRELLENDHWLSNYKDEIMLECLSDEDIPADFHNSVNLVILSDVCFN